MKKSIYAIILIVIAVCFYFYETHRNEEASQHILEQENQQTINDQDADGFKPLSRKDFLPSSNNQVIHHSTYSLSYSEKHEQAEWTAHVLRESDITNNNFKRPYFEIDNSVKTGAAHWRNYKKSGYDRGHLVPAGDRTGSKKVYEETFLTSNISPQEHEFNAGIWNRLEQKTRYYAKRYDELYVVTGPIFKGNMDEIGTENVTVPSAFYKIIYRQDKNGNEKILAFLMPHKASSKPIYDYVTSVDEIEKQTGIDFFSQIPDHVENQLEASNSSKGW
ncbi:DNA/RNA non-specific endonuclease [Nonlabens ulvanivorans]|uniref:DNA/RNA non-specific endonuclease n=1 Tax=Nonlabens ulvanivorans TaxID=906888 RepID=UPI002943A60A|nr:DNA/RNA non-specific endonuclease [Nonlabens ulvanivorans]WOI22775.1 DNA/RNA non-specific endonuclease [Nonlabens ulvanivorans]